MHYKQEVARYPCWMKENFWSIPQELLIWITLSVESSVEAHSVISNNSNIFNFYVSLIQSHNQSIKQLLYFRIKIIFFVQPLYWTTETKNEVLAAIEKIKFGRRMGYIWTGTRPPFLAISPRKETYPNQPGYDSDLCTNLIKNSRIFAICKKLKLEVRIVGPQQLLFFLQPVSPRWIWLLIYSPGQKNLTKLYWTSGFTSVAQMASQLKPERF